MSAPRIDPFALFGMYMSLTGVPALDDFKAEESGEGSRMHAPAYSPTSEPPGASASWRQSPVPAALRGKRLGIINGSSWTSLWSTWFGRTILPGVQLVTVGNEAVQLSFMKAYAEGKPVPPAGNVDAFVRYARDLVELYGVDAIIITCSTMNRSAAAVRNAMAPHRIPVVQIDEAMMEAAVDRGGSVLVVATHGPTVRNTQALLRETATARGCRIEYTGATVEEAFELLGAGDIAAHNEVVAEAVRDAQRSARVDSVVLAQLSMSVFEFSFPDACDTFGVPVYTSGRTGFERVRRLFEGIDELVDGRR